MAEPEILNLPPAEAVEHFRNKAFHVGYDWRETDAAVHLRSFTVAKAMRLDILQDIRTSVDKAIAEGITFEDFQKELEPLLRKNGWWGGNLGSTRRLRIIFDTNIRMAYAKGRWEMIERQAAQAPWLMYDAVNDRRTRPQHLAWDGTVLRWDDPFWRTHYPPNGWRCRCRVVQLSDTDLEEFGLKASSGPPAGSGKIRPWLNKVTGQTVDVPVGIDPGFSHNVGRLNLGRDAANRLVAKIDSADEPLARASVGNPWRTAMFRRFLAGASDGHWPVAVLGSNVRTAIGAQSRTVRLSAATATKQARHHSDHLVAEHYALVQRILDDGALFDLGRRRASAFLEIDGRWWMAVVKTTSDSRETYLATLHRARKADLATTQKRFKPIKHEWE